MILLENSDQRKSKRSTFYCCHFSPYNYFSSFGIGIPPKFSTHTFDRPCGSWLGTETEEMCVPHYTTLVIVVRHLPNLERICGFPLNNLFSQAQNSISTYSCMQDVTCFSKQVHLCVILYRSADIPFFSNFSCMFLNPNNFCPILILIVLIY